MTFEGGITFISSHPCLNKHKIVNVNICLDRNIVVLMIDKRSPRMTMMQKAEKRIKLSRLGLQTF
jgi:hypothetical protein